MKIRYPRQWAVALAVTAAFLILAYKALWVIGNAYHVPAILFPLGAALNVLTLFDVRSSNWCPLVSPVLLLPLLLTWTLLVLDDRRTALAFNVRLAAILYGLRLGFMFVMYVAYATFAIGSTSTAEAWRFALTLSVFFALPLLGVYAMVAYVVTALYFMILPKARE